MIFNNCSFRFLWVCFPYQISPPLLIRAGCKGDWSTQHVQVLRSLVHAAVPSLNTAHSFLMAQDKSALWGCLRQLQLRVGSKKFPLIPQIFYPTYRSMFFLPDLPVVVKVGTASSGLGKMVLRTEEAWSDFRSISAMMDEFVTCEPFIDYDIDYRIQKIGPHHRVFARRVPDGSSWKANTASNMVDSEEVVTDEFRSWVDMAADACGMTICALDVIRRKSDGAYFILEINPSSIGLNPKVSDKDLLHIRDVTLAAMEAHFTQKQQQQQQLLEQTEESLEVSTDKYDHL